jgi:hypothetical protein
MLFVIPPEIVEPIVTAWLPKPPRIVVNDPPNCVQPWSTVAVPIPARFEQPPTTVPSVPPEVTADPAVVETHSQPGVGLAARALVASGPASRHYERDARKRACKAHH